MIRLDFCLIAQSFKEVMLPKYYSNYTCAGDIIIKVFYYYPSPHRGYIFHQVMNRLGFDWWHDMRGNYLGFASVNTFGQRPIPWHKQERAASILHNTYLLLPLWVI